MEAEVLLRVTCKQIVKWMVEEGKYLYGVKGKVEGLKSELEWIQCFLRNANDKKRVDGILIQKWISEINDFSYEAEDILEKYLLKVSNPRKEDGIWSTVKWITCVGGDAMATHEVGSEIDALTSKINKLARRMTTYGIKPRLGESSSSLMMSKKAELRRSHSHLPVDDIVGLDDDAYVLISRLNNRNNNNNPGEVIVISGKPGCGKTTLALKVYNSVKGDKFKRCAWIYVSQEFQTADIIRRILLSLYADNNNNNNKQLQNTNDDRLHEQLFKVLEEDRCLVVLDDVWRDWNRLTAAFPTNTSRSKLLITTRYQDLLSRDQIPRQVFPYKPRRLDDQETLLLFENKAFHGIHIPDLNPNQKLLFNEMKELGKEMVVRCNNLPLAIVVLGGVLASKKTLEEWRIVNKNVKKFLSSNNDEEINGVTDVLELSYTDLPYHLRPCFLHLGNFPEDSEIPTKKLYRMWIAEGIVAPIDNNKAVNLEEVANSYLRELVQRSIVQVVKKGHADREKIKTCRLHDLMWNMCNKKAKEINFLSVIRQESDSGTANLSDGKLHRLAIHQSGLPYSQFNKAPHLRSLMFFASGPINDNDDQSWLKAMINDLKLLRLLDLENTGIKEAPRELGDLIHLRYLSIVGTQLTSLPSSIGNLRCLQILDLRVSLQGNCVMRIPNVLWKMKKLKHLYLPSHDYKGKRFQNLKLKGLNDLEVLKNFDTTRCRVTHLRGLENLRKIFIKNEISMIETLKIMVECLHRKNDSSDQQLHLSLKIHATLLKEEATVLSECSCLHTLEITGKKHLLNLEEVKFPLKLTILAIKNCKLRLADMEKLKDLASLTTLCLDTVSLSENCMDCSYGGFLQLVNLKLENMHRLKELKVGGGAMPKLKTLQIKESNKELKIPDEGLPEFVKVECKPCVVGIEKYLTCPYYQVQTVDDDDHDLATQLLGRSSPFYTQPV